MIVRRNPSATRTIRDRTRDIINQRAEELTLEVRRTLESSRVGRGVFWPGNRVPSSAPGDSPARQTGALMESLQVLKRATARDLRGAVGHAPGSPSREYAAFLEFGTRTIAPRPFWRPSIASFVQRIR